MHVSFLQTGGLHQVHYHHEALTLEVSKLLRSSERKNEVEALPVGMT